MTDEEKAIKDLCIKCSSYDFCVKGNQLHCAETVAYIKGLAEGRKEICEKLLEEVRTHDGMEQITKFYVSEIIKNIGLAK